MTDTKIKYNKNNYIKDYQINEFIGRGGVGIVYKAINTLTGELVAIKQIDLHNISQDNISSIETEINLLTKLDHPNIVKYIDFVQTKLNINIILEYIEGGSLNNIVKQNGIPECLVCIFVKQILEGLDYLHGQGIIHRDIKGANLLITKTGTVKLADFGYSVRLTERDRSNSIVGTCYWMAPEVIEQKGNISYACDIWSLGCTIIQLLTSKPPYFDFNLYGALYRIVTDEYPPLPDNISETLLDFLKKCFIKEPHKRPTARELMNHPWVTNPNKKMVKKILNENDSIVNSGIPSSIMNEWKNNYRDNLSSMASSHNDRMERTVSHDMVKDEEENHNYNDEEMSDYIKNKNKLKNNYNERYNFLSKELNPKSNSNDNKKKQFTDNEYKDNYFTHYDKSNDVHTNLSSLSLKHNNKESASNSNITNLLNKKIEIGNIINTKSLSFQDDNFVHKSRSTFTNDDNGTDLGNEIINNFENLKMFQKEKIKIYLLDMNLVSESDELILSRSFKGRLENKQEVKLIIEIINDIEKLNENELFLIIFRLLYLLNNETGSVLITLFIKNFSIISFLNILNSNLVNNKIIYLYIHIMNMIIMHKENFIDDLITYQFYFYITKLIHLFSDIDIKMELIFNFFLILLSNNINLKNFLSAGGFFLIPNFLDSSLIRHSDILLVFSLNCFLRTFQIYQNKFEEIAEVMINNKILSRLNVILYEAFYDESYLESEYCCIILEKVLDMLIQFTELKVSSNAIKLLCNDNILTTLINLSFNIPVLLIPKLLKVFDNLLKDSMTINRLENLGYIEFLVKLLNGYFAVENDNEIDKEFFIKITKLILLQIRLIIKLNSSRCEQFTQLDGLNLINNLSNNPIYDFIIVPIISELIFSTRFVRDSLKKIDGFDLLIKFMKEKKNKDYFQDIINNILFWLNDDKIYIENYIIKENIFHILFLQMFGNFNLNDFLSILLKFCEESELIQKKFFNTDKLIKEIMDLINTNKFNDNRDIYVIIKVMDFLDFLINNRKNDNNFINEIKLYNIVDQIVILAKENNFVILEEKIKKFYQKINSLE